MQQKGRKSSISAQMMKYQTCNLSSSGRKARDFNGSTLSASSLKQVGAPSIPANMKHHVKLAKLDLS